MIINFKLDKFVVIGTGETGRSVIRYLEYKAANILHVLDTRKNPPQLANFEVIGGELDYSNINDANVIVISPGISIYHPILQEAIHNGKLVIGDIELFAREIISWNSKVIGITGSNGKTTTTALTGFLAQESGINTLVAGNIGKPVLDAWLEIVNCNIYPELIVLELSSFQLETTHSLCLNSATVLNISEDHLDRYRDLMEYAYIKSNIFNNSKVQVINQNDSLVMSMIRNNHRQIYFSEEFGDFKLVKSQNKLWLSINQDLFLSCDKLSVVGRHNYLNVLASLALLDGAGYDISLFKGLLSKFIGLEHRMQKVVEHNDVIYIEDSKGTNVGAVLAGVNGLDRPVHLILGGDGKGQDFLPLRNLVLQKCKSVAIIGQDAQLIAAVLEEIPNIQLFSSLQDAVIACIKKAVSGDAVVLSPACASWDMFKDYKHRAQVFIDTIYANIK